MSQSLLTRRSKMNLFWLYGITIFLLNFYYVHTTTTPNDSCGGISISKADNVKKNNNFSVCENEIKPCDPYEGRRLDGTCNNLKHHCGAAYSPLIRILPAAYDKADGDYQLRKMSNGKPFPPARKLRTTLIPEGKVSDPMFTHLMTNYLLFTIGDVKSLGDILEYGKEQYVCCSPNGKPDPACVPNNIPNDDPFVPKIRCINMTRPSTFQSEGCVKNNTVPKRALTATSEMDLSILYTPESLRTNRYYKKGLLKYEIEDGKIWPPSDKNKQNLCKANRKPRETRCHRPTETMSNGLIGINLNFVWFWRNHNRIALALSELNPCWDDDMLFDTARDINAATMAQILYYEMLTPLMGTCNLLRDGVISSNSGFRDPYNEETPMQIAMECAYGLRWFHGMQEGLLHMYDQDGNYLSEIPAVDMSLRTGCMAIDNNMDYITQGSFRQACAKGDNIADPDMANRALGSISKEAFDIFSTDLAKGRYFGFQPYVAYRKHYFGKSYKTFDDLKDVFTPERLDQLKDNYKNVEDIELMAGLWLEKHVEGGHIPETLYCIMADQAKRFVVSDRHWYERPNRPNAFTEYQLQEIRKASMSRLLCEVGDKVTKIQPNGFLVPGLGNQITDCDKLPRIDLSAWQDESCEQKYKKSRNLYISKNTPRSFNLCKKLKDFLSMI